jgi:hypothetical protein
MNIFHENRREDAIEFIATTILALATVSGSVLCGYAILSYLL